GGMGEALSPPSPATSANSPRLRPADCNTRIRLSVEGHLGRDDTPGPARLDGLKLVGSRPARRASPEADRPSRRANASIAFHNCGCDRGICNPIIPGGV